MTLDPSEGATRLRQATPFCGIVSVDEGKAIAREMGTVVRMNVADLEHIVRAAKELTSER